MTVKENSRGVHICCLRHTTFEKDYEMQNSKTCLQKLTERIVFTFLANAFFAPLLCAQMAGELDTTFGSGGIVNTALPGNPTLGAGTALAIGPNGKIVAVGFTREPSAGDDYDSVVARYNADGTLDSTFAGVGVFKTEIGGREGETRDLAIDHQGRVLVAGGSSNWVLARYSSSGTLDATFANGGITQLGGGARGIESIALQADGKIVAAGRHFNSTTLGNFAVLRYNADGSLDSSFGSGGIVITDLGADEAGRGVAIDSSSRILVAGNTTSGAVAVARYNADGTLDTTFDGNGLAFVNGTFGNDIVLDANGKIVVAGGGSGMPATLWRFNADGSLDTTFDGDGVSDATVLLGQGGNFTSVTIQSDGKIVAAGRLNDAIVVRFNDDGSFPDTSFAGGVGGVGIDLVSTANGGSANDVVMQSDGKIVVVGTNVNPDGDFAPLNILALSRLNGDNLPPTAVAGNDQSIRAGDTVLLDGTASFDDNTDPLMLLYSWSFLSVPAGSSAVFDDATSPVPSFVADINGTYTVQLVVTDEAGAASDPDTVDISSTNLAPVAVATSDFTLAIVGNVVNLDGSDSFDPESDPIIYDWAITSAPVGSTATLLNDTTATPSFTPDLEGDYQITLTVSDFIGPGDPAVLDITATTAEDFAEIQIVAACDIVDALDASQVKSKGNQKALCNFLTQAIIAIQKDDNAKAIDKLNKSIDRVDGCALRGAPDGNGPGMDWVIDCDPQIDIYNLLVAAKAALTP